MSKFRLLMAPLLACALLAPSVGVSEAASTPILNSSLKIHPLLQLGAINNPDLVVRVIVQKKSASSGGGLLGGLVGGLLGTGGKNTVVEDFTVIPASVMDVTQGSIAALARDANVRYISPDGPVEVSPGSRPQGLIGGLVSGLLGGLLGGGQSQKLPPVNPRPTAYGTRTTQSTGSIDASRLALPYPFDTGAQSVWAAATGQGVTVAVLDSGVDATHPDLVGHVASVNVNRTAKGTGDGYGHGTHVAGIIGGQDPTGQYVGIAPRASIISVKVSDDTGGAYESDVLRGLEWVALNHATYRIRVISLSLSTSVPASYATSPIDAAVERLWDDGVTVVAAAGNRGTAEDAVWYAPGNDPLVITVGCLDENETTAPGDDSLCPISSRGITEDGFAKPEMLAPGRKIASPLSAGMNGRPAVLASEFADRITPDGKHLRLSGTSMAAPMVTGAIALLLQNHPNLTPDQIKKLLVNTTSDYSGQPDNAGTLNIAAALSAAAHPPAAGFVFPLPVGGTTAPSGSNPKVFDGARWGNTYWDGARWGSAYWDAAHWDAAHWDAAHWDGAYWDAAHWDAAHWDAAHWDAYAGWD